MSLARVHNFSISLDGFGTGEGQSHDAPFGHAGERLHQWMFATRWWRGLDKPGGSGGVDDVFAQQHESGIGGVVERGSARSTRLVRAGDLEFRVADQLAGPAAPATHLRVNDRCALGRRARQASLISPRAVTYTCAVPPGRTPQAELPLNEHQRSEIAPGAVHLPGWVDIDIQKRLVEACREWARPPAPMRATRLPSGAVMSVQTACLGWHWLPYRYSRTADDIDGAPVPPVPHWVADLGRRAVLDAYGDDQAAAGYEPDAVLINFYSAEARLGMHQDKDERAHAPVVSLSLGDACLFRFGNTANRSRPYTDLVLRSGDLFVFGGPSRFAFHGVPRVYPGTADPALGLAEGRLNLTMRVTGLPG